MGELIALREYGRELIGPQIFDLFFVFGCALFGESQNGRGILRYPLPTDGTEEEVSERLGISAASTNALSTPSRLTVLPVRSPFVAGVRILPSSAEFDHCILVQFVQILEPLPVCERLQLVHEGLVFGR